MTHQAGAADALCPSCNSPNAASARFCGSCGAQMQSSGFTPPPAPPMPPVAPNFPSSRFMPAGLYVDSLNCTAPLSLPAAIDHASRVISASGGRVLGQMSPTALQIEVPYKDLMTTGGMKVAYRGVLNFAPQGPQQTMLSAKLSIDWNSAIWVLTLPLMCAVVAGMGNPYFFMMWLIFGVLATAVGAWALSSMGPRKCGDKLAAALASGGRM